MTSPSPTVSVLMSVYDGLPYLREAVDSVLGQSYPDFEVVAIDDGSTDGSGAVLDAYAEADPRLRVVHQENRGLIAALNRGLGLCRGRYTARMDADDVCLPDRLGQQVAVLDARPDLLVLGGASHIVDAAGVRTRTWTPETDPDLIRWRLLFKNPVIHPTVLFRTDVVREAGGYDAAAPHAEDYALWVEVSARGEIAAIADPVLDKRDWGGRVSVVHFEAQEQSSVEAIRRAFQLQAGLDLTVREAQVVRSLYRSGVPPWPTAFTRDEVTSTFRAVQAAAGAVAQRARTREGAATVTRDASDALWRLVRGNPSGGVPPVPGLTVPYARAFPAVFARRVRDRLRRGPRSDKALGL